MIIAFVFASRSFWSEHTLIKEAHELQRSATSEKTEATLLELISAAMPRSLMVTRHTELISHRAEYRYFTVKDREPEFMVKEHDDVLEGTLMERILRVDL